MESTSVVLGTVVTVLYGKWNCTPCEMLDHSDRFLAHNRFLTSSEE
jgi:hypothetical protein